MKCKDLRDRFWQLTKETTSGVQCHLPPKSSLLNVIEAKVWKIKPFFSNIIKQFLLILLLGTRCELTRVREGYLLALCLFWLKEGISHF